MRPSSPSPAAASRTRAGRRTFRATRERMSAAVATSWRKSVARPREIPHVARTSTSAATRSEVSSAPRAASCSTRGASVRRSAIRIALDAKASPMRTAKARSARATRALLREPAKLRAVRRVDSVELGGECGERGVAELRDEAARQIAGEAGAVLLAGGRGAVEVGLALTRALDEPLLVGADRDCNDRHVGLHSPTE